MKLWFNGDVLTREHPGEEEGRRLMLFVERVPKRMVFGLSSIDYLEGVGVQVRENRILVEDGV